MERNPERAGSGGVRPCRIDCFPYRAQPPPRVALTAITTLFSQANFSSPPPSEPEPAAERARFQRQQPARVGTAASVRFGGSAQKLPVYVGDILAVLMINFFVWRRQSATNPHPQRLLRRTKMSPNFRKLFRSDAGADRRRHAPNGPNPPRTDQRTRFGPGRGSAARTGSRLISLLLARRPRHFVSGAGTRGGTVWTRTFHGTRRRRRPNRTRGGQTRHARRRVRPETGPGSPPG